MKKEDDNNKIKKLASAFSLHDNQVFLYDTPFAIILPENSGFICAPCTWKEFNRGNYTKTGHDTFEASTPEELAKLSDVAFYSDIKSLMTHFFDAHLDLGSKIGVEKS
jgi:hypothetical protein